MEDVEVGMETVLEAERAVSVDMDAWLDGWSAREEERKSLARKRWIKDFLARLDDQRLAYRNENKTVLELAMALAGGPKVGIFWLFSDAGTPDVYRFDVVNIREAKYDNGFWMYSVDHEKVWEKLKIEGKLKTDLLYTQLPRGRISFDEFDKKFIVLVGSWIKNPAAKRAVQVRFNIPDDAVWEIDHHYDCDGEWQTLLVKGEDEI